MYNENKRGIADDQFAIATDSRPIDFLPLLVRFFLKFFLFFLCTMKCTRLYGVSSFFLFSALFFVLPLSWFEFSLCHVSFFIYLFFFSRFMEKWAQFYSIIMIVL